MLDNPLGVALALLSGYYAVVALVQRARSGRTGEAWVGAALFAGLTTAAAVWSVG